MRNFKKKEFACPCCGKQHMERSTTESLDDARSIAGVPFNINSGWRCKAHNEKVGGKKTSSHLTGWAVDIEATSSRQRFKILDGLIRAGFKRIGIGKTFIHADRDPGKSPQVTWLYEEAP